MDSLANVLGGAHVSVRTDTSQILAMTIPSESYPELSWSREE